MLAVLSSAHILKVSVALHFSFDPCTAQSGRACRLEVVRGAAVARHLLLRSGQGKVCCLWAGADLAMSACAHCTCAAERL